MYRRLRKQTGRVLVQWRKRPLSSAALTLTILLLAFVGPGACIAHCRLHDLKHAQLDRLGLHAHHTTPDGTLTVTPDVPAGEHEQHREDLDGQAPTALTIAVLLMVAILPLFRSARVLLLIVRRLFWSRAIPPPQRPPRLSVSFA